MTERSNRGRWYAGMRQEYRNASGCGFGDRVGFSCHLYPSRCVGERFLTVNWMLTCSCTAINLINSSSPFVYNQASQTFHQPALSSKLLASILSANKTVLSNMKLEKDVVIQSTAASGGQTSFAAEDGLDKLVAAGAKNEAMSVSALETVFEVLGAQTE